MLIQENTGYFSNIFSTDNKMGNRTDKANRPTSLPQIPYRQYKNPANVAVLGNTLIKRDNMRLVCRVSSSAGRSGLTWYDKTDS